MNQPAVLFVCLGNICRSPLAEAAFRKAAQASGLDARADSAGTAAYHVGEPPDPRSIATAARYGIDISHYRGRQITPSDYRAFTHIFALDHKNLSDIKARAPADASAEIALLLDVLPHRAGEAVADPYFCGEGGFQITWAVVSEAAQALAAALAQNRN